MLKEIFDHFPKSSLSKKNAVLNQNLSYIIKTSKRWHLSMANCYGSKRIQSITQTLELLEAAEENYRDDALLRVFFLDTPGHPTSA